jgi:hypothetical protein
MKIKMFMADIVLSASPLIPTLMACVIVSVLGSNIPVALAEDEAPAAEAPAAEAPAAEAPAAEAPAAEAGH